MQRASGAGREHTNVSADPGVRRWESTPVNKLAGVAAPAWIWLKSSYSRNYNTTMAKWAKITALDI